MVKADKKTLQTKHKRFSAVSRAASARPFRYFIALAVALGVGLTLVSAPRVHAAACAAPSTDLGTDTLSVNIPAAGTYTIWTRMQAPDTSHNAINLQVDADNCFNVGGGSFTATSWASDTSNWINYTDGNTSTKISVTLTAGSHSLKYIGTQAGVMVDKVILSSDASCTPTGMGTNCQSGDSTQPTVNLVSPTDGASVTGSVGMSATASDASGIASVKFLVDNTVVATDTSSPYSANWNSTTVSNGSHTVTAQATDTAGNTGTSSPVTVAVTNTGGTKSGDVNGDGKVNLTDLSILLTHWNEAGATRATGDLNSDGKVNLTDLSILLTNWGK
jgi:hypothetical protein